MIFLDIAFAQSSGKLRVRIEISDQRSYVALIDIHVFPSKISEHFLNKTCLIHQNIAGRMGSMNRHPEHLLTNTKVCAFELLTEGAFELENFIHWTSERDVVNVNSNEQSS